METSGEFLDFDLRSLLGVIETTPDGDILSADLWSSTEKILRWKVIKIVLTPRDRGLSVTCQGQLSLEGTFLINDKRSLRKTFKIFKTLTP